MAKVMVSLSDDLLEQIDDEVRRRGGSRSALLAGAVRTELERRDPDAIQAAVERSRRRFADAGAFDSAAAVRAERDGRR
jgi:metal-responsive CopG/Arc/MetJ family transcriptional regulator